MNNTARLRDLFEQALALPSAARAGFLAAHCADAAQREQIERMLAADAVGDDLLDDGDAIAAANIIGEDEPAPMLPPGSHIGPFVLDEVLGEGGSSTVFRAFREVDGVRQEVALKLLRRGLYAPEAQHQFRREQRALTALKHPGIARLIEGGITDASLAYIALELVDGVPITDYANAHALDLDARLALFVQVCHAVQAAHRALIVHRDLKPSNVLVTAEGEVKLLDFGIAKLPEDDEQTQTVQAAFTPAYAAPEQRSGDAVTTATDVYALGVLLGELVTGQRVNDGSGRTPSARVASIGAAASAPRIHHRQIKGDIDNIVMKAIEAEPERRYASAGALADDVERMRSGQPVAAHPPSRSYRARKFVSRHRGGVAITALFLVGIVAALGVALWQTHIARQQARRADDIRNFVIEILEQTAPDGPAASRPDVPTLVYTAASKLPKKLRDEPLVRTELLYTLGNVLRDMQDFDHSEALLREAELGTAALPHDAPARIYTEIGLTRTLMRKSRYKEAQTHLRPLLQLPTHSLPQDAPRAVLLKLAMVLADSHADMARSVALGRQMIAAYRADCAAGLRCDELGYAANDFASILLDADRVAEARPLADTALQYKRDSGVSLFSVAVTRLLQAKIALYRGDLDVAEADARKADTLVVALGNSLKRKPLDPTSMLVEVLLTQEDVATTQPILAALLKEQRARKESPCYLAWSKMDLSRLQLLQGSAAAATASGAQALADGGTCQRSVGVVAALAELARGRALAAQGKRVDALTAYQHISTKQATIQHEDPLSLPLYLVQSMRLADTLELHHDAAQHAHALLAALHRADAAAFNPWAIEASLLLVRLQTPANPDTSADLAALDHALAAMPAWPITARLKHMRPTRPSRD